MINLKHYAKDVENGFNAKLAENGIEGFEFVVWTDIGKFRHAKRNMNKVTTYINCLMTRSQAAVDTGNGGLMIASDNIALQIAVPTKQQERDETPEPEIFENNYVFVEKVRNLVDEYFSENIITSIVDEKGTHYEAGMVYSLATTGNADMAPSIGTYVTFTVNITVNVVQNGINSRSAMIEIDGMVVPFLSMSPGRAGDLSTDVYSDNKNFESESLTTSTAFSLDISVPATTGGVTKQFLEYLLHGKPNTVHFVKIKVGSTERTMLMTFDKTSISVEGSLNIGQTITLIKVRPNIELNSFPKYFTVGRVVAVEPIPFAIKPVTNAVLLWCRDSVVTLSKGDGYNVSSELTEYWQYDEDTDKYYLPIILCPVNSWEKAIVEVNVSSYEILQQGDVKNA